MKHIHTRALALLLCLAVTVLAGKYAVLASGGYTFVDNDKGQSDY